MKHVSVVLSSTKINQPIVATKNNYCRSFRLTDSCRRRKSTQWDALSAYNLFENITERPLRTLYLWNHGTTLRRRKLTIIHRWKGWNLDEINECEEVLWSNVAVEWINVTAIWNSRRKWCLKSRLKITVYNFQKFHRIIRQFSDPTWLCSSFQLFWMMGHYPECIGWSS